MAKPEIDPDLAAELHTRLVLAIEQLRKVEGALRFKRVSVPGRLPGRKAREGTGGLSRVAGEATMLLAGLADEIGGLRE